jgi:hypothetical protein
MRRAKFIRCGIIEMLFYYSPMMLCLHNELWLPLLDTNEDLPWSPRLMINNRLYRGEYASEAHRDM